LVAALGPRELLRFVRFGLLPVRRLAEEEFTGPGGSLLLAGCALHADLMPESSGSCLFGWLLAMLGQQYGFPVPQGGAGQLSAAMVRRLHSKGGQVRCDAAVREVVVREVVVRRGRAVGVRIANGGDVAARRAVLAAIPATQLYGGLISWSDLPPRLRDDLRRFQWDYATFKLDWALRAPVPWSAGQTATAGTVHVSAGMDEMTEYTAHITMGLVPARPVLIAEQMTTADPCRSPEGTESSWAYTHVPRQVRGDAGGEEISGAWDKRPGNFR
jgi:phytoene dehydrogenase-like protein